MIKLINRLFTILLLGIIHFYRLVISPHTISSCRYSPSCSEYAIEAIKIHGPFYGLFLGCRRIISCRPWGGSGYDPVPKKKNNSHS